MTQPNGAVKMVETEELAAEDKKLEEELTEAGNALLSPPSSVEQLLPLLERLGSCLYNVKQSPSASVERALVPSVKALVRKELFDNTHADVRIYVASCLCELTVITAPDIPYDETKMEGLFRLIVASFENLSDIRHPSYLKRVSILERFAKVRLFLVMVDLKCYHLIVDMFKHFFKNIRDYHPDHVYSSMGFIMILVVEESDKEVLPVAWKLAKKVIYNCSSKLAPYMFQAVQYSGFPLKDYSKLVAFICRHSDIICCGPDGLQSYEEDDSMELEGAQLGSDDFSRKATTPEKHDFCGANYLSAESHSVKPGASEVVLQQNIPSSNATERSEGSKMNTDKNLKGNSSSKIYFFSICFF